MEPELDIEGANTEAMPDVRGPEDHLKTPLVAFVLDNMTKAETARQVDEQRWLRSYRNYRGIYGPDVQFTETEKSRVFVKVTKTKVLAAYGQIADVLFGTDRFPLGIEPTTLPEGVSDSVHFDMQPAPQEQTPQGKPELKPGDTMQSLKERMGPLKDKLAPVESKLKEGPGTTQTQITLHPALIAAKNMEKKIHDQLEEAFATKHLRKTVFEQTLFGTGVMKGPFAVDKEYPKWLESGEYKPVNKTIPSVSAVSCWNFYPDPDADCMEEAEFVIERHKMARSQLRKLKKRPHFRSKAIDRALEIGENYVEKWWEHQMEDNNIGSWNSRFEVLEFWGYVDTKLLEDMDVDLGSLKGQEQVSVNIWVCNGQVLRCVMNPFTPSYIPYYAVPYEVNPYSFFGIGVAENMDDTQTLMNGFMRMAIDNAALSGNLLIEIDETNLVPGQDMKVFPGKVFRRQGGAPGQAIFGTKFPNVSNENMQMFDKARQLADESTGLPSFSHGQTGITGVGRTSSGISMLMSAASGSIRTVVKNIDDYLLAPMGKALFHFNQQFDFDPETHGDLEIKARGTESLMANEVRSQRLIQFLSIVQNPMLAPFARLDYVIREIAKSMDLDPDKVTNSLSDAAIQATVMQQFQQTMGTQPGQQTPEGMGSPSTANGLGNGNIGAGSPAPPGDPSFSGDV